MKNYITLLITVILLSGCTSVISKQPVGTSKHTVQAEDWDGTWIHEKTAINIKVIKESPGTIKLAWIEEKDEDFHIETMTCEILESKSNHYINCLNLPGENLDGYYIWGKVINNDDRIIIWPPSFEAFLTAHKNNLLISDLEESSQDENGHYRFRQIKINDDPGHVVQLIENDPGKFFDWENPIILTKLIR